MTVIGNAQLHIVGAAGGDHAITFFDIHRHWFFAQHMLARFSRRNGLRCVKINWCGNVNGINLRIAHLTHPNRRTTSLPQTL